MAAKGLICIVTDRGSTNLLAALATCAFWQMLTKILTFDVYHNQHEQKKGLRSQDLSLQAWRWCHILAPRKHADLLTLQMASILHDSDSGEISGWVPTQHVTVTHPCGVRGWSSLTRHSSISPEVAMQTEITVNMVTQTLRQKWCSGHCQFPAVALEPVLSQSLCFILTFATASSSRKCTPLNQTGAQVNSASMSAKVHKESSTEFTSGLNKVGIFSCCSVYFPLLKVQFS